MNNQIDQAVNVLNSGGVIIYPTDTAFGIGCRIDNENAIRRIFDIRKRPLSQATPILVDGIDMARGFLQSVPEDVEKELVDKYWPGALTVILNCKKEKVPALVRGNGETLGVRMPDNKIILSIIKKIGVPLLGPSANFHGEKTPHRYEDLDAKLVSMVDYVVRGKCNLTKSSTVIDCSSSPWKVLRKGAIEIDI